MLRKLHFPTRQGTTKDTFHLRTLFPLERGYSCCFYYVAKVLSDSSRVIVITYFAIIFMVLLFRALASKQKLGS